MADYIDHFGNWSRPPNGGANYRVHLHARVASQDVASNTSVIAWQLLLEKDRSYNGFYAYAASWNVTVEGNNQGPWSGSIPNAPWKGSGPWSLAVGQTTVQHEADGSKVVSLGAAYYGRNLGWAPGTSGFNAPLSFPIPSIPRATTPTVGPSPATVGTSVTIALPRASAAFVHDISWTSGTMSGNIATAATTSATWTVADVMGQFPLRVTAPIVINVVTRNGGTVLGSRQVTLLAKRVPVAPAPPTIASLEPAKQFDVRARLVKYDGGEWSARQQLPATSITLVDSASATATCTITLSKLSAVDFPDYSIVDIDVFNGTDWVFTNHRFVLSRVANDGLDPTQTATYTGTEFLDYCLGFAYFQGDYNWDGAAGNLVPTSPGEIMRGVIQDAQVRGWGPRVDVSFNLSETSLGDPWLNPSLSRTYSKGTPGSQVLSGLVEDGMAEYRVEYRGNKAVLILLNPGTGYDYSAVGASPVVNFALAKLTRAPRRATMEKQLTAVTVAGDDAVQITRTKAPFSPDIFGRMEGWVSASGIKDAASANTIGDNALRDNSTPTSERTFEYAANDVAPVFYPYSVFRPGDWVLIPDGDNAVKDRISQITINKTPDGTTLTVLTGDRILSGTASLAKRQSAQTGGSINGGNGMSPSPLDSRIPEGPVINTITSLGYWNTDGAAKSAVTIEWTPVTTALSGGSVTVDLYEVWWRPSGIDAQWVSRGSTDDTTVTLGDWDVLQTIDFRVRARSSAGVFGEFSEDFESYITLAPAVDLDGPIISDLYTDGLGSIYVIWSGVLGTDPAPARMAYVVAEISTDGGTTYVQAGTPLMAAGSIIINPGTWGDFMVRLRPYDRLGNPGTSSSAQTITLVDPHLEPQIPAAPDGLVAVAGAAWDASGFLPEAWFDLTWNAPTLDEDGDPIDIAGYDILGLRDTESVERVVASTTGGTSARIKVGSGETWTFRVRAASSFGGVSAPSDSITAVANATIAAAPVPVAPTLEQYAGLLRIKWSGGGMLPQIKYVYATISSTLTGVYTRAGMPLLGAGEVVVPGLAEGTYYAKMVMVDEVGNTSTSVASAPITLLPITGVTIQTSQLANTGIKLTSGSLTSYDVSGNPTFILNAATGEVWIAPYDAVFDLGASGKSATTGAAVTGLAISSQNSSFNTFVHPQGVQIRNDQTPLSWWEADVLDASLVNFFSPRAVIGQRLRVGDFEMLREPRTVGSRLVIRYKGA